MQLKIKDSIKENYFAYALFLISIVFFMQVMMDLTWFKDELKEGWFIKRIFLSSFLSSGYLLQLNKIKKTIPRISELILFVTIIFSILWPIIGSTQTKVIFVILSLLIFLKNRLIPNEQN
jgi:hypothetical protein